MRLGIHFVILIGALIEPAEARDSLLIWSDEFDYTGAPDTNKWGYEKGYLRNNEAQYYTNDRRENARVENGALVIEARLDSLEINGEIHPITSASVHTKNKAHWLYGKVEVRSRFDVARGTWPAHWMLSATDPYGYWPASGEIDIMEHVGFAPENTHANTHTMAYNWMDGTNQGTSTPISEPNNEWHIHDVVWTQDSIFISYDHQIYYRSGRHGGWQEWPFDHPFYLILNLAIGGAWGGQEGIDSSAFPLRMEIDYVRVYKMDLGQGNFTVSASALPQAAGTVNTSPQLSSYAPLSEIEVEAIPNQGYVFSRWSTGSKENPTTIIVDHNMNLVAEFLEVGELLFTKDFSKGLGSWTFWGQDVNSIVSTSSGDACVTPAVAAETWSTQLDYPGLQILSGESYALEFVAYTKMSNKTIHAVLRQADDPYATLSQLEEFSIGPVAKTYTATLDAIDSYSNGRLEMDVGLDTQEVCFKTFSLKKVSDLISEIKFKDQNFDKSFYEKSKGVSQNKVIVVPDSNKVYIQKSDGQKLDIKGSSLE